jgi:hypothetical protein
VLTRSRLWFTIVVACSVSCCGGSGHGDDSPTKAGSGGIAGSTILAGAGGTSSGGESTGGGASGKGSGGAAASGGAGASAGGSVSSGGLAQAGDGPACSRTDTTCPSGLTCHCCFSGHRQDACLCTVSCQQSDMCDGKSCVDGFCASMVFCASP